MCHRNVKCRAVFDDDAYRWYTHTNTYNDEHFQHYLRVRAQCVRITTTKCKQSLNWWNVCRNEIMMIHGQNNTASKYFSLDFISVLDCFLFGALTSIHFSSIETAKCCSFHRRSISMDFDSFCCAQPIWFRFFHAVSARRTPPSSDKSYHHQIYFKEMYLKFCCL